MIQLKFGFDFKTDLIGIWKSKANTAISAGKVVDHDVNGDLVVANAFGYLLLQEVTLDGPSYQERDLGVIQFDVKAGSNVTVAIPRSGGIIWTDNVTGTAIVVGDEFFINASGVFEKYVSTGTKVAKCIGIPSTGVYELKLY